MKQLHQTTEDRLDSLVFLRETVECGGKHIPLRVDRLM